MNSPKFKVGDMVMLDSSENGVQFYGVIKHVGEYDYTYDIRSVNTDRIRVLDGRALNDYTFNIAKIDTHDYYCKKLTDTEVARRLYASKIKKRKDGYLWVKM